MDLINNVEDRNLVMKEENRVKLLDILRKFGNVVDYMTEPMVAEFYGVNQKGIEQITNRNVEELNSYGYKLLKGEELKQFKASLQDVGNLKFVGRLRLYPIQAVLVIGMMLTESKVAEQLRSEIIKELFSPTAPVIDPLIFNLNNIVTASRNRDEVGLAIAVGERDRLIEETKIKPLENENKRKQDIIDDLVHNVSLATKRQRITRDIVSKGGNVRERYNLLYHEFNLKYHMNVGKRAENRNMSKIDYIDKELNMINELYELAVKVFESDMNDLIEKWKNVIGDNNQLTN